MIQERPNRYEEYLDDPINRLAIRYGVRTEYQLQVEASGIVTNSYLLALEDFLKEQGITRDRGVFASAHIQDIEVGDIVKITGRTMMRRTGSFSVEPDPYGDEVHNEQLVWTNGAPIQGEGAEAGQLIVEVPTIAIVDTSIYDKDSAANDTIMGPQVMHFYTIYMTPEERVKFEERAKPHQETIRQQIRDRRRYEVANKYVENIPTRNLWEAAVKLVPQPSELTDRDRMRLGFYLDEPKSGDGKVIVHISPVSELNSLVAQTTTFPKDETFWQREEPGSFTRIAYTDGVIIKETDGSERIENASIALVRSTIYRNAHEGEVPSDGFIWRDRKVTAQILRVYCTPDKLGVFEKLAGIRPEEASQ